MPRPIKRAAAAVERAAGQAESTALAYKDGVRAQIEVDLDVLRDAFQKYQAGKLSGKVLLPFNILIDPNYVAPKK